MTLRLRRTYCTHFLPSFSLSLSTPPSLSLSLALLNSLMWFWAWILNEKCITTLLFSLSSSLYVSFTILYFNPSLHDRTGDRQNQALCRPLVILLSGTSLLPLSSLLPLFLSPCFFFLLSYPHLPLISASVILLRSARKSLLYLSLSSLHFPHCSFFFPHTHTHTHFTFINLRDYDGQDFKDDTLMFDCIVKRSMHC